MGGQHRVLTTSTVSKDDGFGSGKSKEKKMAGYHSTRSDTKYARLYSIVSRRSDIEKKEQRSKLILKPLSAPMCYVRIHVYDNTNSNKNTQPPVLFLYFQDSSTYVIVI